MMDGLMKGFNKMNVLNINQLQTLIGQPIYVQNLNTDEGKWGLLENIGEYVVEILFHNKKIDYFLIDLYDKTWIAYTNEALL